LAVLWLRPNAAAAAAASCRGGDRGGGGGSTPAGTAIAQGRERHLEPFSVQGLHVARQRRDIGRVQLKHIARELDAQRIQRRRNVITAEPR
jgi:hypothetical protein